VARYSPPPAEYQPGLVLQLRAAREGGDLLPAVVQDPALDSRLEALVLAHGFNNHEGEAGAAYQGFRLRQYARAAPTVLARGLERILADLFWPGDAAGGLFDLVDFLVYPAAVGVAPAAGRSLAGHLRGMPNLRLVHFVGHSLGCRVVLEAIRDIDFNGGPDVGRVCLMAAAAPTYMVESGGNLSFAIERPGRVRILYSDDDAVLKYTFGPGQTLAGAGEGFFPTALGRHGPPPGTPGRLESHDIEGADHGHYWGHEQRAKYQPAVSAAVDRIAEFFHFGAWSRDVGGERSPAEVRDLAPPRDAGAPARDVPARSGRVRAYPI